jgi:hypothetical protein
MPQPTGPVTPLGWDAPWLPDDLYINSSLGRVAQDGSWMSALGIREPRFRIDYTKMIADYTAANRAYYRKAVLEASALKMAIPEYGSSLEYGLRQIVGEPPRSPKIPEAALAGNKWLLGQAQPHPDPKTGLMVVEPDEQLAKLLEWGEIDIMTPRDRATKESSEIERVRAEFAALREEMLRLRVAPDAGGVRVVAVNDGAARYQAFMDARLAEGKTRDEANAAWRVEKKKTVRRPQGSPALAPAVEPVP